MKFVLLLVLATAAACAPTTASVGLFAKSPKPDQAVVESFIRMERDAEAREYLIRLGLAEHEVMARIQLAREAVVKAAEKAAKESR
jgi:hypothetical protein